MTRPLPLGPAAPDETRVNGVQAYPVDIGVKGRENVKLDLNLNPNLNPNPAPDLVLRLRLRLRLGLGGRSCARKGVRCFSGLPKPGEIW